MVQVNIENCVAIGANLLPFVFLKGGPNMTKTQKPIADIRAIRGYQQAIQWEQALKNRYIPSWKRPLIAINAAWAWMFLAARLTGKDIRNKSWQEALYLLKPKRQVAKMIMSLMTCEVSNQDLLPYLIEIGQWAEDRFILPNAPTRRLGRWTRKLSE